MLEGSLTDQHTKAPMCAQIRKKESLACLRGHKCTRRREMRGLMFSYERLFFKSSKEFCFSIDRKNPLIRIFEPSSDIIKYEC